MEPVKIIIVDDHKIIRDGLIAILESDPHIQVVGDAESGDALMDLLKRQPVDLIVVDMHMPLKNGIEVTKDVKAAYPGVKILINTMSELPAEIEKALAAGVNGYLLKTSGSDELIKAINMIANGTDYFGSAVVSAFVKNLITAPPVNQRLTAVELKIVIMLYEEKKHEDIMDELKITKGTLTSHFNNMYRKFKIKTEIGLVKYALREKLIR